MRQESAIEKALVRVWISQASKAWLNTPRPDDSPHLHAQGPDSLRVLVIGDGFAVGYGVLSNHLGIGGALAREVAAQTGRGVDLDVRGTDAMSAKSCLRQLSSLVLDRYDAVILTIGMNATLSLTTETKWRKDVRKLLGYLSSHGVTTFMVAVPQSPIAPNASEMEHWIAARSTTLNQVMAEECAQNESALYIPLTPLTMRRLGAMPTKLHYALWAQQIAPAVSAALVDSVRGAYQQDESMRQAALDALNIVEAPIDERLDHITEIAKLIFGADSAALNFLDRDMLWVQSITSGERALVPRQQSFCNVTIQSSKILVVPDAHRDSRFRNLDAVTGDPHIRFYAGYPIESPEGMRLGALCIMDSNPREFTLSDEAMLRSLSLRVQEQLWGLQLNR